MPNDFRPSSSSPFASAPGAGTPKADYLSSFQGLGIHRPTPATQAITSPTADASAPFSAPLSNAGTGRWFALTSLVARARLYAMVIFLCTLAAIGLRWVQEGRSPAHLQFLASDARGYYVYLPSWVIDGDLNFENQVKAHWDTESEFIPTILSRRTPLGLVRNKYPIGLSLTLAGPFTLAHGLTLALNPLAPDIFRPDGYSVLYQLICLASIELLALGTLVMADALISRHFAIRPRIITLAALLILLGSNYIWYVMREPFMIHIISTFWITASLLLATRIATAARRGKPLSKPLAYLGLCIGMAIICRPSNIFIAPVLVWMLIQLYKAGLLKRRGTYLALTIAGFVAFLPVLAQMSVWHAMTGQWIYQSYEGETFRWLAPRLFKTLFSTLHGLFTWTPLYILPAAGILLWLSRSRRLALSSTSSLQIISTDTASGKPLLASSHRAEDPSDAPPRQTGLVIALIISAAILWYVNSAWHTWYFGWSFGGRAFLELLPVFILGMALLLERASLWTPARKRLLAGLILLMVIFNYGLMGLYQTHRIPRDDYPWGTSVRVSDPESNCLPGL